MHKFIKDLYQYSRAKYWFKSFIPMILGLCYIWILFLDISLDWNLFFILSMFFISILGIASLGYLINDYFDINYDKIGGKKNNLADLKQSEILLLFIITIAIAFIPWVWIPLNNTIIILLIVEVLLFILYSSPVLRLKEVWYLSGIVDALYAYVIIPILITSSLFSLISEDRISVLVLLFASLSFFIIGLRNILLHQLNDVAADKAVGVLTLPLRLGEVISERIIYTLLVIEMSFYILTLLLFCLFSNSLSILFLLAYICYALNKVRNKDSRRRSIFSESFPNLFYQKIIPIITLLILIFSNYYWIFIFIIHIVLFIDFKSDLTFLRKRLQFSKVKSFINYLIYYLFLLFCINLKKENKSAFEYFKSKFDNKKTM